MVIIAEAPNYETVSKLALVKEFEIEYIPNGYSGSPLIEGNIIIFNINTAGTALNNALFGFGNCKEVVPYEVKDMEDVTFFNFSEVGLKNI